MSKLTELREKAGISQAELASRVGTTQTQISRLESGQRRLTMDWADRLAPALGVDIADIKPPLAVALFKKKAFTSYEPPLPNMLARSTWLGESIEIRSSGKFGPKTIERLRTMVDQLAEEAD